MSKEICYKAYEANLIRLNQVLTENIVLADGNEQLMKEAQEKFRKGKGIAEKTLKICLDGSK
jgi:hypothetical protein